MFDSSEITTADNLLHLQVLTEKQEDSADNIKADKSSGASFLVDNLLFAPTGDSGISDKSSLPDSLITYLNSSGVKSKEYQNVPKTEICHSSQALDGLKTQEDILPSEKTTTNEKNNANDIEDHIEIVNINYLSEKSDFYLQKINSFDQLNLNSTPKYRKKSSELIIDRRSDINNNNNNKSSALLSKKNLQLLDQNNRQQLYSIDIYDRNRDQRHSLDDDFSEILAKYKRKNINNNLKRSRTAECTTKSDDKNLTTVDVTTIIETGSRTPTPILEISATEQNKKSDLVDNQWIYINKNIDLPLRFGRKATKKLKKQGKYLEEEETKTQSSSSKSSSCLPCAYLIQKMASLKKVHRKLSKKGSYNLSKNNSNATSRNTSISNVISTISVEPSSYEIEKANKKRSIIVRVQPESGVPGVTAPITDGKNVRNGEMNLNMNPKISCPEDEKENFCQMVKRFLFG